jgi:hypothetical protein
MHTIYEKYTGLGGLHRTKNKVRITLSRSFEKQTLNVVLNYVGLIILRVKRRQLSLGSGARIHFLIMTTQKFLCKLTNFHCCIFVDNMLNHSLTSEVCVQLTAAAIATRRISGLESVNNLAMTRDVPSWVALRSALAAAKRTSGWGLSEANSMIESFSSFWKLVAI